MAGWLSWLGGKENAPRGPQAVATRDERMPDRQIYEPSSGILNWLRTAFGGWLGKQSAVGTQAEEEITSERVKSGPSGIIFPWFEPYVDNYTQETSIMRLAYRRMVADPNVKAALFGKLLSICALDLNVIAAKQKGQRSKKNTDPRDEEIAEFVRWNLVERVQGCFPEVAWAILSGGLVDGYSVCEKVIRHEPDGDYAGSYILSALKPKDTGRDVVLETDQYRNVVGVKTIRYNAGEVYSPANFVIFTHMPMYGSPVGMSDLRAAYGRWWMLDTVLKLRAMGLEKRALPVLYGEYETTAQKPSLEAALASARSQSWFSVPKGVQIQALNIAGAADGMFAAAVADLKEDIFLAIQGATLQALTGQDGAMRGSSAVHKSTSDLFRWYLARCLEVLLNDRDNGLIRDLVDLNYVTTRYPRAVLSAVDSGDLLQEAQLDQSLIAMGMKLSKSALYEKYSRTPPDEDDPDDALGQPPAPGGAPGAGGPPTPGAPPESPPADAPPDDAGDGAGGMLSALQFSESAFQRFAEEDWTHDPSARSQNRWKNAKTGRIEYSKENPGGKGKGRAKKQAGDGPAPVSPVAPVGAVKPPPVPGVTPPTAPGAGKKTPAAKKATKTPAPAPTPAEGEQGGLLGQLHKEGSTPEQAANILGKAKYKDLQALAKEVGEKANGKTHELADRILKAFMASKGKGEKKPDATPTPEPLLAPVAEKSVGEKSVGDRRKEWRDNSIYSGNQNSNPRGYKGMPEGVDEKNFADSVSGSLAKRKGPARTTLKDLFKEIAGKFPGMTTDSFSQAMVHLQQQGAVKLGAYTQSQNDMPDEDVQHTIPLDMEQKYYVEPGAEKKPVAQKATPEPLLAPVKPVAQKATKEQTDAAALKKVDGMKLKDGTYLLKGDPEGRQVEIQGGKATFHTPGEKKPAPEVKKPEAGPQPEAKKPAGTGDSWSKVEAGMKDDHKSRDLVAKLATGKREATAKKMVDDHQRKIRTVFAKVFKTEDPDKAEEMHKEVDRLKEQLPALQRAHDEAQKESFKTVQSALSVDKPSKVSLTIKGKVGDATNKKAQAAASLLGAITAGQDMSVSIEELPTGGRAHYDAKTQTVHCEPSDPVSVHVHELCHHLESQPGIKEALAAFLEKRCGNEQPRKLKDVVSDGYADSEMGRQDDFEKTFGKHASWYVGKTYPSGNSELLSMTMQKLVEDPAGLAQNDPELCQFVIGLLHGRIRG